jgi:hypothetical protein
MYRNRASIQTIMHNKNGSKEWDDTVKTQMAGIKQLKNINNMENKTVP